MGNRTRPVPDLAPGTGVEGRGTGSAHRDSVRPLAAASRRA
jgi:hypothetical protein